MVPIDNRIGIGLLGMGVIGSRVAQFVTEQEDYFAHTLGVRLALHSILVQDITKRRNDSLSNNLLSTNPDNILNDPRISVVLELMGGEQPALSYIERALYQQKHVVTANKEVIAKHGPRLQDIARHQQVQLRYEASVGGGIPIIGPLEKDLIANDIFSIQAIINGTTNFILTKMAQDGSDFVTSLDQAKELGYAESDPRNDLEGFDAAYKLAILATLGFRTKVDALDVYCEGISQIDTKDFQYAHELGYEIKLLAIGKKMGDKVHVRVHPALIPMDSPLAKISGAYNAIEVQGDLMGSVVFSGPGAGPASTTSAILGDIAAIVREEGIGLFSGAKPKIIREQGDYKPLPQRDLPIEPMAELETRYYLRLNVEDRPRVLAQIATIMGDHGISIASVIQKDTDLAANSAEIVITTHPAKEADVQEAVIEFNSLGTIKSLGNLIRVEQT